MMGCSSSVEPNAVTDGITDGFGPLQRSQLNKMQSIDVVYNFVRLDEQIVKLESTCPGPRMATVEAWIEHLHGKRDALMVVDDAFGQMGRTAYDTIEEEKSSDESDLERKHQLQQNRPHRLQNGDILSPLRLLHENVAPTKKLLNRAHGIKQITTTTTTTTTAAATTSVTAINGVNAIPNGFAATGIATLNESAKHLTPTKDLSILALNLGVVDDARKASTHEDFFANLSETALFQNTLQHYNEILEHTKIRLKTLQDSYAELNELYVSHDGLVALISGGTYMTRLEESLDTQLEGARDVRDKLGAVLEQWRICGHLLRACARSATLALQQWHNLSSITIPKLRIQNVLQCRNMVQASLLSLECAQFSLPQVDIKHISNRQVLAVKHCNQYMITDIADQSRYEHTTKVLSSYETNMSLASAWLSETFNNTLRKDFDESNGVVKKLAKTLRDHREDIFMTARS